MLACLYQHQASRQAQRLTGTRCCSCHAPRSVVIKGATHEDAVLCTSDKTFALKLVETTNTLLLLPPQEV